MTIAARAIAARRSFSDSSTWENSFLIVQIMARYALRKRVLSTDYTDFSKRGPRNHGTTRIQLRPGETARPVFTRVAPWRGGHGRGLDRKSTRLNSSHSQISYAVFCFKKI